MTDLSLAFKRLVRGWGINHIVALYALIGSAWILLSDRIVVFNAPDPAAAAIFSTIKGLGYVAATAVGLHWLINRHTAELRESEERFRIIFEHANDAIHIDSAADEILDVNPRMCELMGYTRDELLAMRIPDLQAPEARAAGNVIVTELARHGDQLFESLNVHRSGRRIPVEISVARVARSQGDLYVSVVRDITERRQAEEELRTRESLLRAVVDNIPFEFWARDLEGRCFMENAALVKHWGSLLGTHVEEGVASPEDVALWKANNVRALAGEVVNEEARYVMQTESRYFQNIVAPIRMGDAIRGILGLNIDITDRKHAEEELRQSQAFNQALIDHSPLGISVRSRTGRLLFANAAWRKIWAIPESDVRDDMARERDALRFDAHDDYLTSYQADLRRIFEQGGYLHLPELKTTRSRPGAAEWVSQHFYAITAEQGQVDRVVILTEDVSDRRRAEEALRESEEQFRSLVEQSPLSTQVLSPDGRTVQVNHAFNALWGLTLEDLTNYNILADQQLVHLGLMPYIERAFSGEAASIPAAEYDPGESVGTGTKKWVQARIYPVKDDAGNIRQVILIHENITERKRHEREIEAIAGIAMALRAAPTRDDMLPIIGQQVSGLLQTDGIALFVREMTTDEALVAFAQGIGSEFAGIRIPKGQGIVGRVLETGRPYLAQDVEHDPLVYRRDALTGLRAIGCVPLIAHDRIIGALWVGRIAPITEDEVHVLAAIADIAANALHRAEVLETLEQRVYDRTRELAEANERLTELDRLKSKFVSDVSHELRTPITSLMLNVELLEHGKPEKREQYLHVIRQQTARQVQLIEDILNLSRLELSTAKLRFAPVDVNALIEQAVGVYHSSAEAANLNLTFTPDPNQPIVLGVGSHLSQVVTNLIANAINYTPAGSVDVATRLDDDEVLIEVRDTGLGIAPEDMPHLFDRFYRGKLTWQVRGSGLGLAIVKEIAEVHQGRVEVDSQAGVGSTFRVYLPTMKQSD